jgi:GTPase SAR1 family protein
MNNQRFGSGPLDLSDNMSNNESALGGNKTLPTFKVVIVGDTSVGKTCLLKRFNDDTFKAGEQATLGS